MTGSAASTTSVIDAPRASMEPTRAVPARFIVASAVGGFCATAIFAWMLLVGRADLFAHEVLGEAYDAQARSLLHGHWDVPASVISFERFAINGRFYMYFGPWPAILRMPFIAFTHELDGRLSRLSMLLAFGVLLAFTARIAWQARLGLRGNAPMGWRSLVATGGFVFVVGGGSTALFLASRAWVYHEAILWAAAWSVASFSFLVDHLRSGRRSSVVWASGAAALALLSRPSTGLGPASRSASCSC